jgi:hypothetical protein
VNEPYLQAISMAMAACRSNADGIAQWGMSRATPEATGHRHRATTCSVSPPRPPGHQQTKQRQKNGPALLAILMAVAVRRYNTARIVRWWRSRASLEATGRCHLVSIAANSIKGTWLQCFLCFSLSTHWIRSRVELQAPVSNRGITYQTKEKGLTKLSI